MKTLAIDFGLQHIGLAISDEQLTIASPLQTFKHRNLRITTATINHICQTYHIKQIIVGDPQNNSVVSQQCCSLAKRLTALKRYQVDIINEALSTREAQNVVQLHKLNKKKIHTLAATIILERFINAKK